MAAPIEKSIDVTDDTVETYEFEPIQGYPRLQWNGKRPFRSTQYYPAQLKETYGEEVDGWINKIYWGDNLQVMSHLLKTYRGKINLIYIDPPFDSKANYKKKIELKGKEVENDHTAFEEKQYTDIWTDDEYLQFMFERLILMRELLTDNGSIYVHCDWRVNAYIRLVMDDIFGPKNFVNQIEWVYKTGGIPESVGFSKKHDHVLFYKKGGKPIFNPIYQKSYVPTLPEPHTNSGKRLGVMRDEICELCKEGRPGQKYRIVFARDVWDDIPSIFRNDSQGTGYDTQKPEALIERIIKASSNPGDLIFDCFMGSGTTHKAAMKLGRRFIGADINLGAVEITTNGLHKVATKLQESTAQTIIESQKEDNTEGIPTIYTGFEVYNVNNYAIFRNPVEAKELLIEALEIQPWPSGSIYDGEKDGYMVKIMPINRIATRADLNELIMGFDYHAFERSQEEHPTRPVEKILLVCMGHEPGLRAALEREVNYKIEVEVVDILRDKSQLEFKREAEAKIIRKDRQLIIEQFYPMNLLQKLSLMKENVTDWRKLVESVKIDFNYDGGVMTPSVVDLSGEDKLVKGTYPIPEDAGTIRVKITDLLSESLEHTVE